MTVETLQNGSDIRGIALTTDDKHKNLGIEEVYTISKGIINWLKEKRIPQPFKIGIGHDSRITGPELKEEMIRGFKEAGCEILDFGLATTPALFMSTQFEQFDCDAGIMLTASHLPYYFNGIKIFSKTGGAEKQDIKYILSHTASSETKEAGTVEQADLLSVYAKDLVDKVRKGTDQQTPLDGMHIVVDAGNGAGGYFAEKVLEELGADTTGSQFLEPDGRFPNHIPNPDNKEAMASIKRAVLANKADLGVIFDTDVDRSAVVSSNGEMINRNNLIAVLSSIVLSEYPGSTIVTNSPTSDHLKRFIEEKGGKQYRYISGYRNVINKAIELNEEGIDCQLAIETSSHAAFKENYFLDDGAYVIAKILMLLPQLKKEGRQLTDLMAELKQPAQTLEVRCEIQEADSQAAGQKVLEYLKTTLVKEAGFKENTENQEGVRFTISEPYAAGWLLVRLSLHEPLLVIQIESDEAKQIEQQLPVLYKQLKEFPFLDTTTLEQKLTEFVL